MNKYVIGIDFGTDSCRALLVDVITGEELASDVEFYPRWKKGLYCDPAINQYRQHPLDYMESMELAVRRTLSQCPEGTAEKVVGIAIDTTGSTPVYWIKAECHYHYYPNTRIIQMPCLSYGKTIRQ